MIHIGIDTSNYKTSMAAVDDEGRILANISEYLDVPEGKRGLRQSDAFFKHSNRLPKLTEELLSLIDKDMVASVGASYAPRRVPGSYMPCFLAGINTARVISQMLDVPYYEFSHQEGHAAAVIESGGTLTDKPAILMHLSGGTTEFLKFRPDDRGYETEVAGGTLDISFGQLIDRFGVALGLPFPSGAYIDVLASKYDGSVLPGIVPSVRVKDGYFNLSGPERVLMDFAREYRENRGKCVISGDISKASADECLSRASYELLDRIAEVLLISSEYLAEKYNTEYVYMAGGVASSDTIRNIINERHDGSRYKIVFGDKKLSGDNAVGTALLSRRMYSNKVSRDRL